jgi:hypothetical protein
MHVVPVGLLLLLLCSSASYMSMNLTKYAIETTSECIQPDRRYVLVRDMDFCAQHGPVSLNENLTL